MWTLFKILFFLALVAYGLDSGWSAVQRQLPALKAKDAALYRQMELQAKGLNLPKALESYQMLRSTSKEEFIRRRYMEMKEQWNSDRDYRRAEYPRLLQAREGLQQTRLRRYGVRMVELEREGQADRGPVIWEKLSSWQKSLLLREKCIKFLERERQESASKKDPFYLPRVDGLGLGRGGSVSAADLCARWVLISHDDKKIDESLNALEKNMDYFYFSAMLREAGLSPQKLYPFSQRLARMSGDTPGR
jgi:hypothetical protein